jgi:4-cresol dehydrogenase (hydroxylating)
MLPGQATAVVGGFSHFCHVLAGGALYCSGQSPATGFPGTFITEPKQVDLGGPLVHVGAGNNHVCALYFPNDRSCIIVNSVTFDVTDADVAARAYGTMRQLITEAGARGSTEYRAHVDAMDLVSDQLDFNDHAYRRFTEKIKDAVDPRGIFAAGRHGVWPTRYRESDGAL